MSYSGHSDARFTKPKADSGTRVFSLARSLLLVVVIFAWGSFAVAATTNPAILDDIWMWAGGLPMAGQIVVWTAGLPWMISIVILQTDWTDLARFALIGAIAILTLIFILPSRS